MESDLPGFLGHNPDSTATCFQVHTLRVGDGHFQVFVSCCQIRYNRLYTGNIYRLYTGLISLREAWSEEYSNIVRLQVYMIY